MLKTHEAKLEVTDRDFLITRVFDAPRSLVFEAWVDPVQMAQWWGPRGFTNSACEMDVRPGGAYRIVMRSPEGVEYPLKGVFHAIVSPELIVKTDDLSEHPSEWKDLVIPDRPKGENDPVGEAVSTVTFDVLDTGTELTVHTRFRSARIRSAMVKLGMTEGWSQSLERLKELLEKA